MDKAPVRRSAGHEARDRKVARLIRRAAASAAFSQTIRELEQVLSAEPYVGLDLRFASIFRRCSSGLFERTARVGIDELPEQLHAEEPIVVHARASRTMISVRPGLLERIGSPLDAKGVSALVPFFVDDVLHAFALFGVHENGMPIDERECALLADFQQPAETAYALLARRMKKLGELGHVIARAPETAGEESLDFLVCQFLEMLPEPMRYALVAASTIPSASPQDVICGTDDTQACALLDDLSTVAPIVRIESDGTYTTHRAVSTTIRRLYPDSANDVVRRCADGARAVGNHERAAELYAAASQSAAAAAEVERYFAEHLDAVYSTWDLAFAPPRIRDLARYPRLWINQSASQLFKAPLQSLIEEARLVAGSLGDDEEARVLVKEWTSFLQIEHSDVLSLDAQRDPNAALVLGRLGLLHACSASLERREHRGVLGAKLAPVVRAAHVERMYGRWEQEQPLHDAAIESLDATSCVLVPFALAEALCGAWFAGDARATNAYLTRLRATTTQRGCIAFDALVAAAEGKAGASSGVQAARWRAYAQLMLLEHAESWSHARELVISALEHAIDANEPFLILLARVAGACIDEPNRFVHLAKALESADVIGSIPLTEAIQNIAAQSHDFGMLARFVDRASRERGSEGAPLVVEFSSGCVRRGAEVIALSERELALALAIARSAQPVSSAELADLIWPEIDDEEAAAHVVQTCMHRLRGRLGDPKAIVNSPNGYTWRRDVSVDLTEIERAAREAESGTALDTVGRIRLEAIARTLRSSRPPFVSLWEWFVPFERRLEGARHAIEIRLAHDAEAHGDSERAIAIAREILERDELDETAWEVILKSLVGRGDLASAQRELRRYTGITQRELQSKPSRAIIGIVEST